MKSVFVLCLLATCALSFNLDRDYEVCTKDAKVMVDDIFSIVETFEKDPLNPDAQPIKDLLASLQTFLGECFNVNVDLTKYDNCVDMVDSLLPMVKKLVDDIKAGQTSNIIGDATALVLQAVNGAQKCVNPTKAYTSAF